MPLYSADGKLKTDTVMLPGRHACQCLAQKHKLINNCMYCGRIVCEQEGSGISPVDFCFSKYLLMGENANVPNRQIYSQSYNQKYWLNVLNVVLNFSKLTMKTPNELGVT